MQPLIPVQRLHFAFQANPEAIGKKILRIPEKFVSLHVFILAKEQINEKRDNMKKHILLLAFTLSVGASFAQFAFPVSGARGGAMGGTSAALNDFWSGMDNISGLSQQKNISVGLSFRENFLLSELSYKTVGVALPVTKNGTVGAEYTHFGNSNYNEQRAKLMYAQQFGKMFSLGVELDYLHSGVADAEYDKFNMFTFGVGMQFYASPTLQFGAYIFNPISAHYATEINMDVPALFRIGTAYQFVPNGIATLEFEKDMNMDNNIRFGLEYKFFDFLMARLGISTAPVVYSLGFGIDRENWQLDLGMQVHTVLGVTPQVSAVYHF